MTKRPRIWRYIVVETWGDDPPVKIGDVLVNRWKADRTWQVFDFKKGVLTCGWYCDLLGELSGEMLDKYWASKDEKAAT